MRALVCRTVGAALSLISSPMRSLAAGSGALGLLLVASQAHANLILNGNIENNTAAATMFNMTNATFDATVSDATAFGVSEEIDLVTGTDFGVAPQSGSWKLGLHSGGPALLLGFGLAGVAAMTRRRSRQG